MTLAPLPIGEKKCHSLSLISIIRYATKLSTCRTDCTSQMTSIPYFLGSSSAFRCENIQMELLLLVPQRMGTRTVLYKCRDTAVTCRSCRVKEAWQNPSCRDGWAELCLLKVQKKLFKKLFRQKSSKLNLWYPVSYSLLSMLCGLESEYHTVKKNGRY